MRLFVDGYFPTQNKILQKLKLKKCMNYFDGIFDWYQCRDNEQRGNIKQICEKD